MESDLFSNTPATGKNIGFLILSCLLLSPVVIIPSTIPTDSPFQVMLPTMILTIPSTEQESPIARTAEWVRNLSPEPADSFSLSPVLEVRSISLLPVTSFQLPTSSLTPTYRIPLAQTIVIGPPRSLTLSQPIWDLPRAVIQTLRPSGATSFPCRDRQESEQHLRRMARTPRGPTSSSASRIRTWTS
jgi:hypothetical protein